MKYRKKPIVIEAVQLRWDTWSEMCKFAGVGKLSDGKPSGSQDGEHIGLDIPTLEGVMHADENDYVIKGIKDELYPCKPDIFEQTYELVTEVRDYICTECGLEIGIVVGVSQELPIAECQNCNTRTMKPIP